MAIPVLQDLKDAGGNLIRSIKAPFRDDWCKKCGRSMNHPHQRLFAITDMRVGHYESHTEIDYYRGALWPVTSRSEIPAGVYACRAEEFHCPRCGRRKVKLTIFLPVRHHDKPEEIITFDNGKALDFLWN